MTLSRDTMRRCRVTERRSIRPGSWAIRSPSRTSCSTGNSHHPGTRPRCGMPRYRIVAVSTAVAIGQRGSAAVRGGCGAAMSPAPALVGSLMEWLASLRGAVAGRVQPGAHAVAPCAHLDRDADREGRDPHERADQHGTPDAEEGGARAGTLQAGADAAEEQRG